MIKSLKAYAFYSFFMVFLLVAILDWKKIQIELDWNTHTGRNSKCVFWFVLFQTPLSAED